MSAKQKNVNKTKNRKPKNLKRLRTSRTFIRHFEKSRKSMPWTFGRLAEVLERRTGYIVTEQHLAGIERGLSRPSAALAEALAEVFGVTVDEILELEEESEEK